jgi:hypothetical protein
VQIDNEDEDLYHSINEDPLNEGTYDWIVTGPETKEPETEQSNKLLREQMREPKRTKGKLCKNGCGKWIYLQEDRNGKWQPHNQDNNEFHHCSMKPSKYKCYDCGNSITFDEDKLSESGKPIPLNKSDLSPHQCPNDSFYRKR